MNIYSKELRWVFVVIILVVGILLGYGLAIYNHHARLKEITERVGGVERAMELSFEAIEERLERVDEFPLSER